MIKSYSVYKGLQKPLVFKGMKGRFIMMIIGFLVSVFILGTIIYLIFGGLIALLGMVFYGAIGGGYISKESKKGLYPKKKHNKIIKIYHII